MEALSHLQFASFEEMIPPNIRAIWAHGLETREFALKLCGAGGGGFFLGYRLKNCPSGALKF
jgi:mevalonate kinase